MKIPLAQMARSMGIRRKKIELRPIIIPRTLENLLFSIYADSLRIWAEAANSIASSFTDITDGLTADRDTGNTQRTLDFASARADGIILYQTEKLGRWVARVGEWHGQKTIAGVKSATGIEIRPFVRLSDVDPYLRDSVRANIALMKSLNADTKSKLEQIVYDGLVNRRTKKFVTDEIANTMRITKARARLIAGDQTDKLNISLTAYRNQELGIEHYIWQHTPQKNPRHTHIARHGRPFRWDAPPDDGPPGFAINCKCYSKPLLDMEDGGDD